MDAHGGQESTLLALYHTMLHRGSAKAARAHGRRLVETARALAPLQADHAGR